MTHPPGNHEIVGDETANLWDRRIGQIPNWYVHSNVPWIYHPIGDISTQIFHAYIIQLVIFPLKYSTHISSNWWYFHSNIPCIYHPIGDISTQIFHAYIIQLVIFPLEYSMHISSNWMIIISPNSPMKSWVTRIATPADLGRGQSHPIWSTEARCRGEAIPRRMASKPRFAQKRMFFFYSYINTKIISKNDLNILLLFLKVSWNRGTQKNHPNFTRIVR